MKRVVTGVNAEGRSYVVSSEELDQGMVVPVWDFEPEHVKDIIEAIPEGVPALWLESVNSGGAKLMHITHPPASELANIEMPPMQGLDEEGWHTSRTLDFDYLVSGKLTLLLDEETVYLEAGDYVIQQATRHAWRNETEEPAQLIAMLITPFK